MQVQTFVFNMVAVNTYLLYDETHEAVIIDCGASNLQEQQLLSAQIRNKKLTLRYLLNTHLHFDHTLGNRFIFNTFGLKPRYHRAEDAMPDTTAQVRAFGIPINEASVKADEYLDEGDIVRFGNTELHTLFTPGHSPGGLSFYCPQAQCVFTGDSLFRFDIGRTDLWEGDESTLIASIRNKLLTLPDATTVYPGHGRGSSIHDEKLHNPYIN